MKAGKYKVVSLAYELRAGNENSPIVEICEENNPCEYIFGAEDIWAKIESELDGKEEGYEFNISLTPEEAYGEKNPQAIIDLEKSVFAIDGIVHEEMLIVGNVLKMLDANGSHINGLIVEVTDDFVKMDFNHPLAGKSLFYKGKIMAIREATEKEIHDGATQKRIDDYMAKHGGHHCGGGCCGGCGDDGCGSEHEHNHDHSCGCSGCH